MADNIEKEAEFTEDIFDSMLHGTFEEPEAEAEGEDESVEEDADTAEDFDNNDEDHEDTDQEDESETEEEPDDTGDGEDDEDSEELDEDEEENSPVDEDSSDDEGSDTEGEEEDSDDEEDLEADEGTDEESEDEADTEDEADVADPETTDGIDYKAFYDTVVNTEFVVNGKKTKGFSDPQKVIQSMQMAGGFSEKMAGFKQYRPFMSPLKDRGMLDDQSKFDLAMNLIDGDKEAIKQHLQSLDIDPLDLDMEQIDYAGKSNVASNESLVIEDAMERARGMGIEDRVRQVIGKEWDAASFQEFVSNDAVRNDLLNHMSTGDYDRVQDKMAELSRLDYNGAYGNMNTIGKYRAAVGELQREQANNPAPAAPTPPVKAVKKAPSVKAEKAKIEQARKEEKYKVAAAEQEAKRTQQRKKASSMSKKKAKAKPKAKFDPLKVEGEELDGLMDFLISGDRG